MFDKGEFTSEDNDAQFRKDNIDMSQRLSDMKKRRKEPYEHYEGDREADELLYDSDKEDHDSYNIPIPEHY
jgi:hypothetical protein